MAMFGGKVTFSTPITRGDVDFEAALQDLGRDINEFRAHYGGYVIGAAFTKSDLSITLTFGGSLGLPHLPPSVPPTPPQEARDA